MTPAVDVGTQTESITQWIDPSLYRLTSTADIIAPAGWTLSYSYDGTTWTTATPTAWATVVGVRATGAVNSDGIDSATSKQLATGAATTGAPYGGINAASSSGDGWDLIFDNSNHIFNVNHHDGNNATNQGAIDCHLRSGARCTGTWPKVIGTDGLHTELKSSGWFDPANNTLWYETTLSGNMGFACLDIVDVTASNTYCNGSAAASFVSLGSGGVRGIAQASGKLFAWNTTNGNLVCMQISGKTGSACSTASFAAAAATTNGDVVARGNLVYATNGVGKAICVDASTLGACTGWSNPRTLTTAATAAMHVINVPNSSGTIVATCFTSRAAFECFDSSGSAFTSSATTTMATDYWATLSSAEYLANSPQTQGSKVYWGSSGAGVVGFVYCWDFSTNARCTGFWGIQASNYTVMVDPQINNCIWADAHSGLLSSINTLNPSFGCGSNKTQFNPTAMIPRMGCSATASVIGWRNFVLSTPAISDYTSATVSVLDSTGAAITGYQDLALTQANNRTIDLSALSTSVTGQSPSFVVSLDGMSYTAASPTATVSILGDSPELCTTPKIVSGCPTLTAPGLFTASSLPAATTANIRSEVTTTSASNVSTTITATPVALSLPATALSDCAATLQGTAYVGTYSGLLGASATPTTYTAVPGDVVQLMDATGNAVLNSQGQPITTTTAANGKYSFANLIPGNYSVKFVNVNSWLTVGAAKMYGSWVGGPAPSATATSGSVVVGAVAITPTTPGIMDAVFTAGTGALPDTSSASVNTTQTMNVLANDSAGASKTFTASTLKICSSGQTPNTCTATSVTIAGQGTYAVVSGQITFTPVTNWIGTATPITYQVTNSSSVIVSSTYTPTVTPLLGLVADTASGPWNTALPKSVLTNDSAASGTSLVANSLTLCAGAQVSPNCNATSVTIANQGTYAVSNGQVVFTPLSTFSGTATPVTYQVTDSAGTSDSTTYTPTISMPPAPVPVNDTNSGPWNTAQTITPLANDPAGLTMVGLCLTSQTVAANCTATSLTIANEGTYTLNGSTVTFTPLSTFSGTATPIAYAVSDAFNQKVEATITPTVAAPIAPTATPQTLTVIPGASINYTDVDSGVGSLSSQGSASITGSCIVNPANTSSCITSGSFTVANQGTWSINNGVVTFAAAANVAPGTQTPITYRVTDGAGLTASSTLTAIVPAPPTAVADTSSGAWNTTQTKSVLANDSAATGLTLDSTTLKLCDPASSQVSPNCNATSVTIANQGTYSVVSGSIQFVPLISFTGTATAVSYQISDSLGQSVSTTYTPTVVAPVAPVAVNDTSSGPLNTAQVKTVLANDTTAAGVTLTATSVKLCSSGQTSPNCNATTVTIANQGTYTVNTTTGDVTFIPVTGWSGTATAVAYQVTANSGQVVSATYTPTVIPAPTVVADTTSGAWNTVQTSNVLANDAAASGTTLTASTLKLCSTGQTAPNCNATSVTIANQGTYAIVNGQIQFNPLSTFAGTATPVSYQVTDALGQTSTTTYTPTVAPPAAPTAVSDTNSGAWNTAQTITPLTNDPAGLTIVGLCPTVSTAAASCTATTLTIANQGTYTLSGSTVTFTPLPTFSGTATPIKYAVVDAFNQYATANITPTVAAPTAPTATPQTKTLLPSTTVTFTDVDSGVGALATQGSAAITSSCIVNPANTSSCITSGSFTVANQGTWTIASGVVTFAALANITPGTQTSVTYRVTDLAGLTASSTLTPIVPAAPVATTDTSSGAWNTAQTMSVLTNDTAATGETLVASTLKLCDPATSQVSPNCNATSVTIAGQGTYTVSNGSVVFTPLINFIGTATPVAYQISDSLGQTATTTYTPTVVAPVAPVAVNDTSSGPLNVAQVKTVLANDTTAAGVTLTATSVKLCSSSQTSPNCTATSVTISGQGNYVVDTSTGVVTFTPVNNWSGTSTAVAYQVTANSGQVVSATYTPTVIPAPTVVADTTSGPYNTVQTSNVLVNDAAASGTTLAASTLKLCATGQTSPSCNATSVTIANQGTYAIVNGSVTFTPLSTFAGTATPVSYQVSDALGQTSTTTYTPTVTPPPLPIAVNDTKSGPWNTPQTVTPLTNDPAGLTIVGLCPSTQTVAASCTLTSVTVYDSLNNAVGTYTLSGTTVTFTPAITFSGTAPAIKYAVADVVGQKVMATITPTVAAPAAPIASPQTKTLLPATTTTFTDVDSGASPLATTGSANFVSSCIVNPATPSSCITSGSFVVAGEGTWSINSGVVTFAALANITPGTKTPVTYTVVDAAGLSVSSALTPIVPQPPVASPDSSAAPQGTVQTLSILTNDTAGAASSPLVPSTVRLCTTATVNASCTLTSLTVAGEGVYTVNPSTGVVTFTPDANYVGIATPIKYVVQDSLGQIANSTISPVVVPPPAVAAVTDTLTLAYGATGTFNPLTNDSAGITNPIPVGYTAVGTVSLNTSTLKLCGVGETYPSCTATTVTTVDGTYVLNGTTVVFTPVAGFTGTAVAPPTYLICNAVTGTWLPAAPSTSCATAQLIPTVTPPANPTATPDTSTNYVNTLQTMSVLANDSIPAIAVPSTLRLCGTNQTAPTCTATSVTTADGTFTVVGSTITFMPVTDFVGTAAAISYVVTDQLNHTVSSTYTPTVTPPPPPPPAPPVVPTPTPTPTATPTVSPTAMPKPIAKPDIKTGPMNKPITLVPVANDIKAAAELVATSVVLCTTSCEATANSVETKVGVWAVDPSNGNVTFTPVKNWFGRASLGYFILDAAGNRVKSTLTVIIPKAHIKGDLAYTGVSEFTWPIAAIAALLIGFGIWLRRRSR
jgi:CshA-type fibril repeat protein